MSLLSECTRNFEFHKVVFFLFKQVPKMDEELSRTINEALLLKEAGKLDVIKDLIFSSLACIF